MLDKRLERFNELYKEANDYLKKIIADIEEDVDEILTESDDCCFNIRFAKPNNIIFETNHKISTEDIEKIEKQTGLIADYYKQKSISYKCKTDKIIKYRDFEYHFFFKSDENDNCKCKCC